MNLSEIVCTNLDKVRKEHDLSTNELASRSGVPQKTIHNLMNQVHIPRLDTVESVCKALLVSTHAAVTAYAPMNILLSRRIGRVIEAYAKLTPEQRDHVEMVMSDYLNKE